METLDRTAKVTSIVSSVAIFSFSMIIYLQLF